MTKIAAISLRSQWLGERLRSARHASGYTMREAGEYLQADHTTLGRFERGTHRIRRAYVKDLVDFYGITDTRERDMLIQLAEDAWRKDWWDGDSTGLEMGFIDFTWLESRAKAIRAYEPLIVHGLLQTPGYAEALQDSATQRRPTLRSAPRTAEIRATRQRILTGNDPTNLSIVMEEPAVRHAIGGRATMAEQLAHIMDLNKRDHIEVLVLPMGAADSPGHQGPFTYFDMPDPYPAVAYIENLAGRTFLEEATKVDRFEQTYDVIRRFALSADQTNRLLNDLLKDLE